MNPGLRDLAGGAFASGLCKLNEDPEWHDDRTDLDGPFRLGFPRAQGWGEELLVASLLKRHAGTLKPRPRFSLVGRSVQSSNMTRAFTRNYAAITRWGGRRLRFCDMPWWATCWKGPLFHSAYQNLRPLCQAMGAYV